jgi:hypothetical protein
VVASGSETLLTADTELVAVEQVAEELPSRGHLVALEALLLGHQVYSSGGWHTPCQSEHAVLLEVRDLQSVVCNDGQRVTGRHERVRAVDHVAVTITVGGSSELDAVLVDRLDERVGVDEVRVGVLSTEVGKRFTVLDRGLGQLELVYEDADTVGTRHSAQSVEENLEVGVGLEVGLDQREVEDLLHVLDVVGDAVDDLDLESAVGLGADGSDVDLAIVSFGKLKRGTEARTSGIEAILYSVIDEATSYILLVTFSGAGAPFDRLYLIPKSSVGPAPISTIHQPHHPTASNLPPGL